MKSQYLLGLDIGSGHGACLLLNIETSEILTATRAWTHPPAPGEGRWGFDLDTASILRLLRDAVQEVIQAKGISPVQIAAISTTSMRHGTVVIDQDGEEIFSTPTMDARAAAQSTQMAGVHGESIYRKSGHWPLPIFTAVRLGWLANKHPALIQRAKSILSVSGWLNFRLSGSFTMEHTQAAETLLYDIEKQEWDLELIDMLKLPPRLLPRLVRAGERLGGLTKSAADYFGLREGIPLIAGGGDTQCALIGAGAIAPGDLGVIAGTTTPIQLITDKPVLDPEQRTWTGGFPVPKMWVLESNAGQTGATLEWIAKILFPGARKPVRMLTAAATFSEPGAFGINSTLGATLFNAREMGVPIGNITISPMLADADTEFNNHVARAVVEGMAYGVQANIDQILEITGVEKPRIHLGGGMARSQLFAQILCNVSHTTVQVSPSPEAAAHGAAICAAVGGGIHADLPSAVQALVKGGTTFNPQAEQISKYQSYYKGWLEMRTAQADADLQASELILEHMMDKPGSLSVSSAQVFRPRILVTAQISADALQSLEEIADVEYQDYRAEMRLLSGQDLVEVLQGYHALVTEIDIVDVEALKQLPDLRLVICCRGDPVNIDIEACTVLGIPVLNTPARNADAVADLTIAFMLMLCRQLPEAIRFLRQDGIEAGDMGRMGMAYETFQGNELWHKTVGLVGLGAIGCKVAQRLAPFGAHVLAFDPYQSQEKATLFDVELVPLDTLLRESDMISLHAPVTPETRGMIGADQLASMKKGAYLINTARAALLDEDALFEVLAKKHLGGAALDVFSIEPPGSDHPLLKLANVIVTPHIGGNTQEVANHQGWIIKDELERLLQGQRPKHILNPATLENFNWTSNREQLSIESIEYSTGKAGPAVSDLQVKEPEIKRDVQTATTAPEVGKSIPQKKGGLLSKVVDLLSTSEKETETMTQPTQVERMTEQMEQILRTFIYLAVEDQALREFASTRDFCMYFALTDLKHEFYLQFTNGTVSGDLHMPENSPDLTLKMKADILDGMFTGRINATRAAMTGKMSFSGDTRKAMAMQKVQKDLTRLYTQAREKIGDPGDLTVIGSTVSTEATETLPEISPHPVTAIPPGDERDEILSVLNELYTAGLITSTGGNISARREREPSQVWITPSQIFKGNLRADMMVRIDLDGKPLDEEALSASSERLVHCAIYRKRPDIHAVIHTHAPNTTVLMMAGLKFLPISTEVAFIGDIPTVPFIMPGTKELGELVADTIGDGVAVFMQNHGLVVGGSNLRRAADLTEIIETTAEKLLLLQLLGKEPQTLPKEVVNELSQYRDLMA